VQERQREREREREGEGERERKDKCLNTGKCAYMNVSIREWVARAHGGGRDHLQVRVYVLECVYEMGGERERVCERDGGREKECE